MSETWQSPKQICTHANLALRGEVCLEERRSFSVAISDPHFAAPKLEGEEVGPTDRRAASQDDDDLPHASKWGFPSGWG